MATIYRRMLLSLSCWAALAALALVAGCTSSDTRSAPASSVALPVADAKVAVAGAALVVDVRSPEEFEKGHLSRAVNVPVDGIQTRSAEIAFQVGGDRTKPIVVYCASGARAATAKAALEAVGFTRVTNAGGYDDLKS